MIKIKLHKDRRYSICSCGLSKILPFCDNEHRSYNEKNGTVYKSIKLTASETIEININSSNWK